VTPPLLRRFLQCPASSTEWRYTWIEAFASESGVGGSEQLSLGERVRAGAEDGTSQLSATEPS